MKKIKVLHLLQSSKFSGAESVVCQIIESFRDDEKIEMIYMSQHGPIEKELNNRKINYVLLNNFNISEIRKAINDINPDIIHAHDFTASVKSALIGDYPIISHIHNNPSRIKRVNYKTTIYRMCLNRYSKIIGVSTSIINEFVFKKAMKDKFILLPNVVDKKSVLSKGMENCDLSIDLLFVGRLTKQKQPLEFLEIVKRISCDKKDLKAVMIGEGELLNDCEDFISKNNLQDNVKMLGFVSNPYKYMNKSKILIMPSIFEGFGLVAVEAMIFGVPVICRGVGGLVDIVDNEVGYICNSIESFTDAATFLLENSTERELKGKLSKEKANNFCDLQSYNRKLIEIYNKSL